MASNVKIYLVMLVAFLAIDAVWLTLVAPGFYRTHIGHLMAQRANLLAALVFYLLFLVGLLALAVVPGIGEGSLRGALWRAALFGLVTYATYDLTNLATLRDWPLIVTLIDMGWGMALSTLVSLVGFMIGRGL